MSQAINLRESVIEIKRHLDRLSYNKPLQAWIHYEAGEIELALAYWEKASQSDDDKGLVARRSLAVHYHSQAYDLELEGRRAEAVQFWSKALSLWVTIFQSQTFRGLLPRFSTVQTTSSLDYSELDAFIEVLCECVLLPNQNLANRAVESEDWDLAGQQIELIRKSGFQESIYGPVLDRILQKLSPITHGTIEHTTFDESGARSMEARAALAEKYFPTKINGKLAILVAAIWRGKKASETLDNIVPTWNRINKLHGEGFLDQLDSLRASTKDQNLNYLTRNRLQEVAQVACELEVAYGNSLWRQGNKAGKRLDELIKQINRSAVLSQIDTMISIHSQFVHPDRDAARRLCEELCGKYGESLALSKLVEAQTENHEIANRSLVNLRTLRSQMRSY